MCLNTSLINIHELSTNCHRFRQQKLPETATFVAAFVAVSGDNLLPFRATFVAVFGDYSFGYNLLLFSATFVAWCGQAITMYGETTLKAHRPTAQQYQSLLRRLHVCCF